MFYKTLFVLIFLLNSCGCGVQVVENERSTPLPQQDDALDALQKKVNSLQMTMDGITSLINSDFSSCSLDLPAFEAKICAIARSASAEQQQIFVSQLREMSKIIQTSIYGVDCTNEFTDACPASGSVMANVADLNAELAEQTTTIEEALVEVAEIAYDLAQLQNSVDDFSDRLDAIEADLGNLDVVLDDLAEVVDSLSTRVSFIEGIIPDSYLSTIMLCEDNEAVGPVYESVLYRNDLTSVIGYVRGHGTHGLVVLKKVGDLQGDLFLTTEASTKQCNYRIYERNGILRVCWHKVERLAPMADIDLVCDVASDFADLAENCSCQP
jgi:uncharacterized coiled-coil protein SlyX